MSKHNELGKKGEEIARVFLMNKGHQVLAVNYRYGHKEIDLISTIDGCLVCSEIKTRSTLKFGFPEEAVTLHKQNFIKEAATAYWEDHPEFRECRFDVISIIITGNRVCQIKHFEDAFF